MTTYHQLKNRLMNHAYEHKIPISGEFEILSQCNFNCPMCYAKNNDAVLSKEEWFHIFDMAHDAGLLYATLTGGEIFLHPDFIDLYNYLYDLGVKITLFTNGSIHHKSIIDTLKKRPPEMITITIYGHDQASYRAFTESDAFDRVDQTIDLLKQADLNLVLRTIPMPMIYQQLDQMIDYATSKALHLGYFLYVSKTKNQERLSSKELLDFELRMKKAFPMAKSEAIHPKCGAFRNGYFVNHKGYMQACPMMPVPTRKIKNDFKGVFLSLQKEWEKMLNASPCHDCELNQSCMTCLAKRYLEGNVFQCSAYLKDIAREKSND